MQTMNGIGSAITFWHQGREAGGVIASQRQNLSPDAFVAFQPCRAHAGPATRLPGRECRRRVVVVVVVVLFTTYARSGLRQERRVEDGRLWDYSTNRKTRENFERSFPSRA